MLFPSLTRLESDWGEETYEEGNGEEDEGLDEEGEDIDEEGR